LEQNIKTGEVFNMGSDDEVERSWVPSRTYDFELKIEDIDLSSDIMQVNIMSSIEIPYVSVIITLFVDPNDLILNKIYGQTPLKFTIRHFQDTAPGVPDEQIEMDLMYVSAQYDIEMKSQMNSQTTMKDRSAVQITTVCKEPFKLMNTYVNGVYIGMTLQSVINDLARRLGATLDYDSNGANTEVIDQVLIPPMTFYQALRYLDKTFGLFNGMSSFLCLQDKPQPKIYVKNLTSRVKTSNLAIIRQLASGSGAEELFKESTGKSEAGSYLYYTYRNIETNYKGNTAFSIFGPRMIHIVKPSNKLYHKLDITTETFARDYGIGYMGKTIYYDKETLKTDSRIAFFKDHTGYEETQTHINANWSRILSDLSSIVISLERNVFLLPLLNTGDSIGFFSLIDNMKDFQGRYILSSTDLSFQRGKREFESNAKLTLIRTNRTLE
jgi:hypothetical protein